MFRWRKSRKLLPAPAQEGRAAATAASPALPWNAQRYSVLWADIDKRLIDAVVVNEVDRLTRSLADFEKMDEVFDAPGVPFVAVTQQFNTTTSMGRLTLNVLLSFAQFEREVTGEPIQDFLFECSTNNCSAEISTDGIRKLCSHLRVKTFGNFERFGVRVPSRGEFVHWFRTSFLRISASRLTPGPAPSGSASTR
jgi:hypothetical protein